MRVLVVVLAAGCGFEASSGMLDASTDAVVADAPGDGSPGDASTCPTGYVQVGTITTSLYRLDKTARTARQHAEGCAQEGTHLAVPTDAAEVAALQLLVNTASGLPVEPDFNASFVFVGIVQQSEQNSANGGWITATGTPVPPSFWHTGEPNDSDGEEDGDEQFGVFWRGFKGSDMPGDEDPFAGLCECDGLPTTAAYTSALQAESR